MKRVSVTGVSIALIIGAFAGAYTNSGLADPQELRDMLREVPDDPLPTHQSLLALLHT